MIVAFEVPGEPTAAKRPRFAHRGKFTKVYDPDTNVEWKRHIRDSFLHTVPDDVLHDAPFPRGIPLAMSVEFRFSRKKSHFGTGRNLNKLKASAPAFHTVKPDVDNLLKLVKDALNGLVYADDSQVCRYDLAVKRYDDRPRTVIRIYPAEPEPE